jgi:voltage-gated potassium channel Kch
VSAALTVVCNVVGAAVVLITLRDVLKELFHPGGSGSLSKHVQTMVWHAYRRLARDKPARLAMAGPIALVGVLVMWTVLLALGWALVYWPYLPDAFRFSSPLHPSRQASFGDALYFSLVALTTLGYGDITPTQLLLRYLVTIEAALGAGLVTAGISWTLSLYPVLSRRRALAQRVLLLRRSEERTGFDVLEQDQLIVTTTLADFAAALAQVRVDLGQSDISYVFYDEDTFIAMPTALPVMLRLAEAAGAAGRPEAVRIAGVALEESICEYAETVRTNHLHIDARPVRELLARYAADQCHEIPPPRTSGPPENLP